MTELREYSKSEISRYNNRSNIHVLIHGKVYDVHEFVAEHPGGDLVLLGEAGKDATKAFEDIQHSDDATELMKDYLVGYCTEGSSEKDTIKQPARGEKTGMISSRHASSRLLLLLAICLALLVGLYRQSW